MVKLKEEKKRKEKKRRKTKDWSLGGYSILHRVLQMNMNSNWKPEGKRKKEEGRRKFPLASRL